MSEFSSPQVSPGPNPNMLYDASKVAQAGQTYQSNQLHMQGQQMDLTAADHEQVARLSAALLNEPDLAKRADLYSRGVGMLQSQNLAKYAPPTLPDESTLRMLAAQGVSSEKLYEYGAGRKAAQGALGALGIGSTGAGTGTGTTGTAPPTTTPPGSGATIGQRQNNPGNLTFAGQPGASPGQGNRFASFPDMPTGVAATANQLALYQEQHGINTVRGAVTRWVSDPKADLTSYTADVAKALGVGPDDPIDLTNPDVQAKFIQAQFPHESAGGGYVLNPADVAKGVQMAAANRGRMVQAPGTAIATAAPVGGGGTPGSYQVASTAPTAPPGSTAAPTPLPPDQAVAQAKATGQPVPVAGSQGLWALPSGNLTSTPPQPATPTASPPATTPAPAAPAPPVPLVPLLDLKPSGLTAPQEAAAKVAFAQPMTPAAATALTAHYQQLAAANVASNNAASQTNFERQRQAQADARQTVQDQAAAQHQAVEEKRQEEQLQLSREAGVRAAEEAAQKAKAANRPLQGTDIAAQHENILNELAPKIRDGTATEAEQRLYAGSYYAMQQAGGQALQITDPNDPGGTIAATLTRRLPPQFPEPPGGALPQVLTTPGAAKAPQMSAPQSLAAGFADRIRNVLPIISDTSQAAMNRWQVLLGKAPVVGNSLVTPEFQQHVQAERDFINAVLRRESGAAISEPEFISARQQYIPQPGDSQQVLAQKQKNRETVQANLVRDAGSAYRPPATSADPAALPVMKSPADAEKLAPGTKYQTPDGRHFVR